MRDWKDELASLNREATVLAAQIEAATDRIEESLLVHRLEAVEAAIRDLEWQQHRDVAPLPPLRIIPAAAS